MEGREIVSRYGRRHRAIRAAMLVNALGAPCVRCGQLLEAGDAVDLDHADNGLGYRGLAHSHCNRSAGAARGHLLRKARRHQIMKLEHVAIGVEASTGRLHTSIAAAARDGERIAVVLLEYLDGTDTAATVAEIAGRAVELLGVVIDPRTPAATLVEPLLALGVDLTTPTTYEVAVARGRFVDELRAGRLKIAEHPNLDAAAQHALARPLAGGEALDRRKPPSISRRSSPPNSPSGRCSPSRLPRRSVSTDENVPDSEADWQPLRRAFADALVDTTTFLPRDVERRVLAQMIDTLTAENIELTEKNT